MFIDKTKMDLLLANKCMTLGELAINSGIDIATISRLRSGSRKPRPQTLGKIARALGTNVENLINKNEV